MSMTMSAYVKEIGECGERKKSCTKQLFLSVADLLDMDFRHLLLI